MKRLLAIIIIFATLLMVCMFPTEAGERHQTGPHIIVYDENGVIIHQE